MHTEIEDQVQDNLRNLLLTNKGERLGRFNYGGSLRELTYELLGNENYEGIIMARIKEAVDNFLPFVELNSFSSENLSNITSCNSFAVFLHLFKFFKTFLSVIL